MWVPTIHGDIDVGNLFPISIDVGGLGPRLLVDYTADRNNQTRAGVVVVADVTIDCTCYCYRMHWVQTNQPIAITGCTGCKRIILVRSQDALGANGSSSCVRSQDTITVNGLASG
jgi:hypothetical protein